MFTYSVLLLTLVQVISAVPLDQASCGYQSCPKAQDGDVLNIHLVPHTHDDVGWLKTFSQYYYGLNDTIQKAGVQYILDTVVHELLQDTSKRFIYVETAFFWKWWLEQDDITRDQVKKLVNNGQLEFVGGAWSMHDEAAAHYQSMLDQTTWGFRKLVDTFGECGRPKVGWQIDPFGHSKENANLMANYGFDGLFLGRIDWRDKKWRITNKTMEMIWHTSFSDDSEDSKLFTGVLYNIYAAPKGFCFDIICQDEPIIDNRESTNYNAKQRAGEFLESMLNYSRAYRTNNVLVTMGEDFQYQDAHVNFKNMDKLIKQINTMEVNGTKMNAFYSTPSCYLKAVNNLNITLPSKYDDFLPYSSDKHSFWTGFYSSRPTSKYFERIGNNFLQVCKQLYSLTDLNAENTGNLDAMREAMGIMQHHDAITGTEKQHVANDYARILSSAFDQCLKISQDAFNKLMPKKNESVTINHCLLKNISVCDITESSESFVVTLYNPLSYQVDYLVKLPIPSWTSSYKVLDPKGSEQEVDIRPIFQEILKIPGRKSNATGHLYFMATNISSLGYKSFYIYKDNHDNTQNDEPQENITEGKVGYDNIFVKIKNTGEITHLNINNIESSISQSFLIYEGAVGNNKEAANRSSGAYIFRPNGTAHPIKIHKPESYKIMKGPILTEVYQKFTDWLSQVIRFTKNELFCEIQWQVGPIPISDGIGKEIIKRYEIDDIKNNGIFLTDSNGREYIERKLNYRPTWDVELDEKISGNYYPVTTIISIADNNSNMAIVTDRAQGGTSLDDGQIELMVHRRLLNDDAFGVDEALNETAFGEGLVAVGSHYLAKGNTSEFRNLVQSKILDSWIFISPTEGKTFSEWQESYNMEFSGLKEDLPKNVQILTLEPWKDSTYLLRLEHIMAEGDDPIYSKPVTVNIKDIFSKWKIQDIKEVKLGADRSDEDVIRMKWNEENFTSSSKDTPLDNTSGIGDDNVITLKPMQIKTFIFKKE